MTTYLHQSTYDNVIPDQIDSTPEYYKEHNLEKQDIQNIIEHFMQIMQEQINDRPNK